MSEPKDYRGYLIVGDGTYGQVFIRAKGSGKIPAVMTGTYTSPAIAQQFIDRYLNSLKTKK